MSKVSAEKLAKIEGRLGRWLSAALSDPMTCEDMKNDINAWFDAVNPQPVEEDYIEPSEPQDPIF